MGVINDIETQLGEVIYQTLQGPADAFMQIDYVNGSISAFSDITDILSLPADFEDVNISLTNGSTVSLYGFDAENTLVVLTSQSVDEDTLVWCHCFKYGSAQDYATGKTLQTPDISLRV